MLPELLTTKKNINLICPCISVNGISGKDTKIYRDERERGGYIQHHSSFSINLLVNR